MAKPIYKYEEEEIARVNLDFDALEAWRDTTQDDLPICSCFSLYKACGLQDFIKKYSEVHDNAQIIAVDNLFCNINTLERIKKFIIKNWEIYSIDIKEDNHVYWDTKKWKKGQKHYAKKLKAKIRASVNTDFYNFCPGIDEEIEDNVIIFRIYHKTEVTEDEK